MKTNGLKSDNLYDWLLKRDGKQDVPAQKPVVASTNKKIVWQTKVQEPVVHHEEEKEHNSPRKKNSEDLVQSNKIPKRIDTSNVPKRKTSEMNLA